MKRSIITLTLLIVVCCLIASTIIVVRQGSLLRRGPGTFYPVIAQLDSGTQLRIVTHEFDDDEDSEQWIKVFCSSNNQEGFISRISTQKTEPKDDVIQILANQIASTQTSRHATSAGIKGFGETFTQKFNGDSEFLDFALSYNVDEKAFKNFKKDTYMGFSRRQNFRRVKLPKEASFPRQEYFTEAESGLGLGISSVIAAEGIYYDKPLQNYVNHIGLQLVEAFNITDIDFKFFILNIAQPNAYATPGGIIFVTKGMLKTCENEAELAVVLAHEIAHVVYAHGLQEILKRKPIILAGNAFNELAEATGGFDDEIAEVEKSLENDIFNFYELVIRGRLQKYEQEADEVGIIIAARAGYDPTKVLNLLNRMLNNNLESNNEHYRKEIIQERIQQITEFFRKNKFPNNLMDKTGRYRIFKNQIN